MRLLLLHVLFFCFFWGNAQGLRNDMPLQEVVLFGELHMMLPVSVLDTMDVDKQILMEVFEDLGKRKMRDESGDLSISMDQKEVGVSRKTLKNLTERMAKNFYKGTIYRNEEMTNNGLDLYILDFIGYWNGAKEPSSLLFLIVFGENHVYSMSFKYPEADFDYSDAIKEEMIYSIRIEN